MKRISIILSAVLVIFSFIFTGVNTEASSREDVLLGYVNEARIKEGLQPLSLDATLTDAALIRAKECDTSFSHTRPDGSAFYTVSPCVYGENLAKANEYNTLLEVFEQWMASPSHRANILYRTSTKTGFGIYEADGVYYVVEEFD